jgi:hypothetical protein
MWLIIVEKSGSQAARSFTAKDALDLYPQHKIAFKIAAVLPADHSALESFHTTSELLHSGSEHMHHVANTASKKVPITTSSISKIPSAFAQELRLLTQRFDKLCKKASSMPRGPANSDPDNINMEDSSSNPQTSPRQVQQDGQPSGNASPHQQCGQEQHDGGESVGEKNDLGTEHFEMTTFVCDICENRLIFFYGVDTVCVCGLC